MGGASFVMENLRVIATTIYSLSSLSFIAIFLVISNQRKDIARFGLTNQFIWLALYGLVHGLADLSGLFAPLLIGPESAMFVTTKLVVKSIAYLFLLYFGVSELIEPGRKRVVLLGGWVAVTLVVMYAMSQGHLSFTSQSVALYIGFPSALVATAGAFHLALKFKPMYLPVLPTGFFALGSFFLFYAASKVLPVYSSYPQFTSTGQYVLVGRALMALGICTSTWRILRAFKK